MLTKALVLTEGEVDLLSRVLEAVKAKPYQESEISIDNTQALNALVSYFENVEPGKELCNNSSWNHKAKTRH